MTEKIIQDILKIYNEKPHRLEHVIGVRDTAKKLGTIHNCDLRKLEIAALLHDVTKYYTYEEHKKLIESYFPNSAHILKEYNEHIVHAFSGVVIASTVYNVKDTDILDAIMSHTIGRPGMSIYEEIIFVSDYIEPHRTYDSCVKVRKIAFESLTKATYTAIDDSIRFYEKNGGQIPETAYQARLYYKHKLEEPK